MCTRDFLLCRVLLGINQVHVPKTLLKSLMERSKTGTSATKHGKCTRHAFYDAYYFSKNTRNTLREFAAAICLNVS